jgi:hypothetical protein
MCVTEEIFALCIMNQSVVNALNRYLYSQVPGLMGFESFDLSVFDTRQLLGQVG